MIASLKIKFNLVLALLFVLSIFGSGIALSIGLHHHSQEQLTVKASLMLQAMDSVRYYTNTQLNEIGDKIGPESEFLPQTIASYSAREVFEHLRINPDYADFFYKEATLNPMNVVRDQADAFEIEIIQRFRHEPHTQEITGYRSTLNGELFYMARPIAVTESSCLQCHGQAEQAPRNLLVTYGREHGFGWQLHEIVGAQMIFVPTQTVFNDANQLLLFVLLIIAIVLVLVIAVVNTRMTRLRRKKWLPNKKLNNP